MRNKYNFVKIVMVLCFFLCVQSRGMSQSFLAATAASAKVATISLGEGLTNTESPLLLELVTKAGLMPVLTGSEAYTFFAPSEQTLQQYKEARPEVLKQLLSQHIVKGTLTTSDLKDGSELTSINGSTIKVYRKKGAVIVNGMRVKEGDKLYTNGVWHQLNGCFTL